MQNRQISTDSIKDQIYSILKEEIVTCQLNSGEQLIEQAIADRFHVSRSPVREAIQQLTGDGLVVNITNRGTFVKRPTLQELTDMQEMRQVLEVFALRKIAQNLTEPDKEELNQLKKNILNSRNNPKSYLELEYVTWTAIVKMSGNEYVADIYCNLYAIISNFSQSVVHMAPDSFNSSINERIAIIDALLTGDVETAVECTKAHLQSGSHILCEALKKIGIPST